MATNAFIGRTEAPTEEALQAVPGPAKAAWDELLGDAAQGCGANVLEWKSHSPKAGWALRVKRKERTMLWLSPSENSFTALVVLGSKAMQCARASGFSKPQLELLQKAPKYPEGYVIRLGIRTGRKLAFVQKLLQIKKDN